MSLPQESSKLEAGDASGIEPGAKSPTMGMTNAERIAHVGGWTTEEGFVTFGSVMAVGALMRHLARDLRTAGRVPPGWRLKVVSDGDIRMYAPDGGTWLLRSNPGEDFYEFIHGFLTALLAAPEEEQPSTREQIAVEELMQLGYTFKGNDLYPPQQAQGVPEVWVYDFWDGEAAVRDWASTKKAEAFEPGNFNQRRYVPATEAQQAQEVQAGRRPTLEFTDSVVREKLRLSLSAGMCWHGLWSAETHRYTQMMISLMARAWRDAERAHAVGAKA